MLQLTSFDLSSDPSFFNSSTAPHTGSSSPPHDIATMPPASLKLLYFDMGGRATVIRTILRLGGVPFIDARLSHDQFHTLKASLPYGQVPVLEVTTGDRVVQIAETQAIIRYAARLAGMYPTTDAVAALLVDEAIASVDELISTLLMPSMMERDAEEKKRMREAMLAEPLPKFLGQLESRLERLGKYPFFVSSDKIFAHEVVVANLVDTFTSGNVDHIPMDVITPYTRMVAIQAKVKAAVSAEPSSAAPTPAAAEATTVVGNTSLPSKIKLSYFAFGGRGDPIRLAFHVGGNTFIDERLSGKEFAERKASLPFEKLPVLEINDSLVVAQSFPLLCYAGAMSELYPTNDPLEAARTDELIARVDDLTCRMTPSFREQDPEKKRQLREEFAAGPLTQTLEAMDKRVAHWQQPTSPYVTGDSISVADLVVYFVVTLFAGGQMDHIPASIVDKYSHLTGVSEAVRKHPRVQDWFATH